MPERPDEALALRAPTWRDEPATRARMLDDLAAAIAGAAEDWVATAVAAKGWTAIAAARAEEWASGPLPVARFLAALRTKSVAGARPARESRARALPGDRLLLRPYAATVVFADDAPRAQRLPTAGAALVLGAGNVSATPLLDVLDFVFLRGRAVVLKPSPLHARLANVFAAVLAPLVRAGCVRIVAGDAGAGAALARSPHVAAVHLTGSSATWAALRDDQALAGKDLTAEVGCCTPAIVLPAAWPRRHLRQVARQLAAYVAANGGATCVAPRALLLAAAWPQRDELLARLREQLAALPARVPFHAGAARDFAHATEAPPRGDGLPPTLVERADPAAAARLCAQELFTPVLQQFALPGDSVDAFWSRAVAVVRAACFGALSAYVFAPSAWLAQQRARLPALLDALPHGTVAINTWTGLGYGLGTTPWGVPADAPIECGAGWVRDFHADRAVRRVVVRAPLRPYPLPPWLPDRAGGASTLRALTLHALRPSLPRFVNTTLHALRHP